MPACRSLTSSEHKAVCFPLRSQSFGCGPLPRRWLEIGRDLGLLFLDRAVEFRRGEWATRLLVGEAEIEQQGLGPFGSDEAQAHRKALHQPHRNRQVRIAR